jgi:hypothetical protein
MAVYGRIQDGVVAELVTTNAPISTLFYPSLVWVDFTAQPDVAPGWSWNGTTATAPVVAPAAVTASPATLAELQTQITTLQARLAALTPATVPGTAS